MPGGGRSGADGDLWNRAPRSRLTCCTRFGYYRTRYGYAHSLDRFGERALWQGAAGGPGVALRPAGRGLLPAADYPRGPGRPGCGAARTQAIGRRRTPHPRGSGTRGPLSCEPRLSDLRRAARPRPENRRSRGRPPHRAAPLPDGHHSGRRLRQPSGRHGTARAAMWTSWSSARWRRSPSTRPSPQAEAQLARTVNYTLLTPREFARRRRERGGFVARILAGPLIPLLGSPDGD